MRLARVAPRCGNHSTRPCPAFWVLEDAVLPRALVSELASFRKQCLLGSTDILLVRVPVAALIVPLATAHHKRDAERDVLAITLTTSPLAAALTLAAVPVPVAMTITIAVAITMPIVTATS